MDQRPLPSSFTPLEPNAASMTPPNSADGKKNTSDAAPSELSDLDLDHHAAAPSVEEATAAAAAAAAVEEENIEPDHYYEGGRIPVFKPVSVDGSSQSGRHD